MKVIIVENEIDILESIRTYLVKQEFVCEAVSTYADDEEKINLYQYDCLIIDIMLPDSSGINIIRLAKKLKIGAGIKAIMRRRYFNGGQHIPNWRKVGLWTKADAQTYFSHLTISPLR